MDVRAQHRRVRHHIEIGSKCILEPGDRLLKRSLSTHHLIMDLFIAQFHGHLDMVQPGIDKSL